MVVGVLVMILGLTVLVGWHARLPLLIQLHPTFAPMKYNTALCFLCCGASLLAIGSVKRRWLAVPLGAIVATVGLLTLLEYAFDVDLGIDQLLFHTYIITQTSHPGRMSPVAALIFLMAGMASITAGALYRHRRGRLLTGLLSSLIVALSSMALLGYVTGLTGTYGWGLLSRMALHTASGFLSLGAAFFSIAWTQEAAAENRSPRWLPISTTLAAVSATIVLWHALAVREQEQMENTLGTNATMVRNEILARFETEMHSLGHMARSWEYTGQPAREAWEADAISHLGAPTGYKRIAWVDPELQVRWVAPQEGGAAPEEGLGDGGLRPVLEQAREERQARFTPPVELASGDTGILAVVPIFRQNRFEGWIAGLIPLEELLDATLERDLAAGYAVTLAAGGKEFYVRTDKAAQSSHARVVELPVKMHGVEWVARVWPRPELLMAQRSHFTEAVLIVGMLASALLGVTVHLAQGAISRSQQLAATNRELQHEMAERNRAEEELKGSEARFTSAFEHASIGMALVSPEGRWTKVNRALCHLMGYEGEEFREKTFQDITHPEDLESDLSQVRQVLAGEILSYEMEKRYFHKEGRLVWALLSVSLVRDLRGKPLYFISQIQDITERKEAEAALDVMHKELLEASRRAGMAEVATSVLHNVGNVLNSVNISCSVAAEKVRRSRIGTVKKTADLLEENAADLAGFVTSDPRGRKLPEFLGSLAGKLAEEQSEVVAELQGLAKNIDHIKQIVAMQQGYAKAACLTETVAVTDLVEDSLRMNADALMRHEVEVIREYEETPLITVEKHKAVQVLVNLIRNAKQACDDSGSAVKKMTVRVAKASGSVRVSVIDNGVGIPPENLTRIFAHGFTTKPDGHGFGLHGAALAAQEMGGSLSVLSDGGGTGATFTLELPVDPPGNPATKS